MITRIVITLKLKNLLKIFLLAILKFRVLKDSDHSNIFIVVN